jgi:TolB-like protein/Flp pilus assembly protein TadD
MSDALLRPCLSPEQWDAMKDLFLRTIESAPDERAAALERASQRDPAVAAEVRRMLSRHEDAIAFFERMQISIGVSGLQEAEFGPEDVLGGRFRVVRFVASGGMGQVYEAQDLQLGGRVAVKVLRRDIAEWPGAIERFHEEIRLARTITAPQVCRVFDISSHPRKGSLPAVVFFTMEFLEGETLARKLLRDGPLSPGEARRILGQLSIGLQCAHATGILHCDFKPGNIMLCGERVVITDFGLARRSAAGRSGEAGGLEGGTPSYVAPEQVLKEPESTATDVYALGIVAYEIVTGKLPFPGASIWEIERKRIEEPPIPPREARPDLPAAWERAILRCLQRLPADRYQSPLDFAEAIGCNEGSGPSRRTFLGLAAAAAIAISAGAYWRIRRTRPETAPGIAIAINPFTGDAALQYLADGTADRLSDSLGTLPGVRVIARAATERIARRAGNAAQAGSTPVDIAYVVSGEVSGSGKEVRIHLALTEPSDGAQIWSSTYTVGNEQIEAVPPAAVRAMVHALKLDLNPTQLTAATGQFTENGEAYQLYLLGRFNASKRTLDAMRESVTFLRRSVELDPRFALAHAALAYSLFQFGMMDRVSAAQNVSLARESAARALSLQSECAEAFLVQALIAHFADWNWSEAEAGYQRAIRADPNSVLARQWYARMLCARRRFAEANQQLDAALLLDPFDPALRIARGINLTYSGHALQAVELLQLLAAEDPDHTNVFNPLSCALEAAGRYPEAIRVAELGVQLTNRKSFMLSQLGHLYALTRQDALARQILAELLTQVDAGLASPAEVASVYAGWKDTANTLDWLEKGLPGRQLGSLYLAVDPQVDFLRHNQRFQVILAKIHPGL